MKERRQSEQFRDRGHRDAAGRDPLRDRGGAGHDDGRRRSLRGSQLHRFHGAGTAGRRVQPPGRVRASGAPRRAAIRQRAGLRAVPGAVAVSIHGIVADVLLGLAAAVVLVSSAGILVMRDAYQRLHYVAPIAVVAPVIVALAVLVQSGWTENSGETWLGLLFMVLGGPFLAHATIRAARIRDKGDWRGGDG